VSRRLEPFGADTVSANLILGSQASIANPVAAPSVLVKRNAVYLILSVKGILFLLTRGGLISVAAPSVLVKRNAVYLILSVKGILFLLTRGGLIRVSVCCPPRAPL